MVCHGTCLSITPFCAKKALSLELLDQEKTARQLSDISTLEKKANLFQSGAITAEVTHCSVQWIK